MEFVMENLNVGCYKVTENAHLPEYGTEQSACFDLKASLQDVETVSVFGYSNSKSKRTVKNNSVTLYSNERVLVPTGIIFDLNFGQSLRIHPRSGLAWKTGITLLNCEGVVDADYVDPTFVMLYNISDVQFKITDGDRIAQAEIITASPRMNFDVISEKPVIKTDRKGGFGSTGV